MSFIRRILSTNGPAVTAKHEERVASASHTPSLSTPTAVVYLTYDIEHPPIHPGPSWTRFVCISDTHSHVFPVPSGDVLLHAGDLSSWGSLKHLQGTVGWLATLPHPIKIMIAGNHDLCLDDAWAEEGELGRLGGQGIPSKDVTAAKELVRSPAVLQAGIHYLEHEFVQVTTPGGRTWNVYGSPAAPRYALGSFQYTPGDGDEIYAQIPVSTEILLTHTPPYEICDRTRRGKAAGCTELANRLESGELCHCRLHVFGHIHEAHGVVLSDGSDKCPGQRVSVNAAVASVGQAVIVDLQN